MKIIICARDIKGGIRTHLLTMIKYLEKQRDVKNILIISSNLIEGFTNKVESLVIRLRGKTFLTREPVFAWKCTKLIKNILKNENYDILDFHQPVLFSNISIPKIYTVHLTHFQFSKEARKSVSFLFFSIFHFLYKYFDSKQMRYADKVVFVSKKSLKELKCKYPYLSKKFDFVPNFVDEKIFYPLKEEQRKRVREKLEIPEFDFVLFYSGRLDKMKNIFALIKAVSLLSKKKKNITFLVGGDGKLRNFVIKNKYCKYLGNLPEENLNEVYNAVDLTVLPSMYENSPGVIMESILAGTLVISTDVGDVRDLLPKELIISGFDKNSIRDKINKIIGMKEIEKLTILKDVQKKILSNYNSKKILNEKFNIYKKLINFKVYIK
jgi:glycosyltransferase involved in cell wall biosynthesis